MEPCGVASELALCAARGRWQFDSAGAVDAGVGDDGARDGGLAEVAGALHLVVAGPAIGLVAPSFRRLPCLRLIGSDAIVLAAT